jgi:hypothetical protein
MGCTPTRDIRDHTWMENNWSVVHGLTSLPYMLLPRATKKQMPVAGLEEMSGSFAIRSDVCIECNWKNIKLRVDENNLNIGLFFSLLFSLHFPLFSSFSLFFLYHFSFS